MTQPSTPGVSLDPEPAVVSGRGGFEVALSVSAFETLEEGGLVVSIYLRIISKRDWRKGKSRRRSRRGDEEK
jgi:hypothetical protein